MVIDVKMLDFIIDEEDESLDFVIDSGDECLDFIIDEFTQVMPDTYPGPYDVIPKVNPQQLATRNMLMTQNVTVWGIPYEEVHNDYGVTVTIAE